MSAPPAPSSTWSGRDPLGARDRGFTLIELLVVIIIVGILAAVAVPVYLNQRKKAHLSATRHDARQIAIAYQTWAADNPGQAYPSLMVRWQAGDSTTTTATMTALNIPTLSPGTRTHAYDLGTIHPSTGWGAGQQFCIEIGNTNLGVSNVSYYWNSAKGGFTSTSCATP